MRGHIILLVAGVAVLTSANFALPDEVQVYRSLDGAHTARVIAVQKSGAAGHESRIEIRKPDGSLVCDGDYTSSDGEHGSTIGHVAWTPDSKFFVFSTHSSGGHQPWRSPVLFFDVSDARIHALDEYLPPVAESDFVLRPPDVLEVAIWTLFHEDFGIEGSIVLPISFKLSDLHEGKRRRPDNPPNCSQPTPKDGAAESGR